jgi:hypothetical protein
MSKKPIERLYGWPLIICVAIGLVKLTDLLPIPDLVIGIAFALLAITIFLEVFHQKKRKV